MISSLGINFCTASLGLNVVGNMKKGDLVTITAASELSIMTGNEVGFD